MQGPLGLDPVHYTVHPLLVETCLRLVGARIPYNKRSYDTTRQKGHPANNLKRRCDKRWIQSLAWISQKEKAKFKPFWIRRSLSKRL
jgi:hypothetical protein